MYITYFIYYIRKKYDFFYVYSIWMTPILFESIHYLEVLSFRTSCFQFLQFLEVLSRKLEMDPITSDAGLDGASDAIVTRIEQVMRNEATSVQGHKAHVYSLHRKIKQMKEQIDSKVVCLENLKL